MRNAGRLLILITTFLSVTGCRVDFDKVEDSVREARRGLSTYQWHSGSESLLVSIKNKVSLNDTESDIASLEPEAFLKIEQRGKSGSWTFEATAQPDGRIRRQFTHDGKELAPGPETREWLAEVLPRVLRQTGLDAGPRVGRLLAAGGSGAVVAEIERIESDSVQRIYVDELLSHTSPSPEEARRLAVVAEGMGSSSNLERVVEQLVDQHPKDQALTEQLIEAIGEIRSSSGRVRLSDFICSQRDIGESAALKLAELLAEVSSSSEKANGLTTLSEAGPQTEDVKMALLNAAATIRSSSEAARAIVAILGSSKLEKKVAIRAAEVCGSIRSSSERARALHLLVTEMPLDSEVLQALLDATRNISTSSQDQVLSSLLRRDFSASQLRTILQFVSEEIPEGSVSSRLRDRIQRRLEER